MLPTVIEVNKRDIAFLVDGTSALGLANFNAIRDFIAKVIQRLEIGQDLIQVSVAQYADSVKPEFYFNTHSTKRDVVAAMRKMKPLEGSALLTGAALDFARNSLFTSGAGYRAAEGVPKLLVLITGGKSLDAVSQPAQELKRSSILCFAIGNKEADRAELEEMAFDTSLVFTPSPAEFRAAPLQGLLPSLLAPLKTLSGITEGTVAGRASDTRRGVLQVEALRKKQTRVDRGEGTDEVYSRFPCTLSWGWHDHRCHRKQWHVCGCHVRSVWLQTS